MISSSGKRSSRVSKLNDSCRRYCISVQIHFSQIIWNNKRVYKKNNNRDRKENNRIKKWKHRRLIICSSNRSNREY